MRSYDNYGIETISIRQSKWVSTKKNRITYSLWICSQAYGVELIRFSVLSLRILLIFHCFAGNLTLSHSHDVHQSVAMENKL